MGWDDTNDKALVPFRGDNIFSRVQDAREAELPERFVELAADAVDPYCRKIADELVQFANQNLARLNDEQKRAVYLALDDVR